MCSVRAKRPNLVIGNMSNFFEKLKKGMGIEEATETEKSTIKEKKVKKPRIRKVKKPEMEVKAVEPEVKEKTEIEIKKPLLEEKTKWFQEEGQLTVDVYQTDSELIVQSAVAGVKLEDLDIAIEKDMMTIRGERKKPFLELKGDYFCQECYWGKFSRQIILPVEIDPNKIEATLKEGILTIRMPKIGREKKRKITIKV